MDAVREAIVFLLGEYVDSTGLKYVGLLNHIGDLENDDALRGVLRKERNKLQEKLGKAKAYIEVLETRKA